MKTLSLALAGLLLSGGIAAAQNGVPGQHFIENWDLDGNGAVTVAEATQRRDDVFSSFDANEDGILQDDEYTLFDEARAADMQGNGMGHQNAVSQGMERGMNDTNGDGVVSREEFVGMAGNWIAMMDRNGDGEVTTADFGNN